MSKCLVTGGAGFIGSHLVDKLVSEWHNVVVIDTLERQVHRRFPDYLNPKADYYYGRFRDVPLKEILSDTEFIFHCGSKVGVAQSQYEIFDFVDKNINDTAYLLQNCHSNIKKIILSASMAPYGEGAYHCKKHDEVAVSPRKVDDLKSKDFSCHCPICNDSVERIPIDEGFESSALSFYGITKQTQEEMIHLYGRVSDVEVVALRYFSVFGSRQAIGNPYAGPIPIFIENSANSEDLIIFEDGMQTRDFIHVSDVVRANILAMESDITQESFNIANGKSTTICQLAEAINSFFGSKSKINIEYSFRVGDIRHSLGNISKAKKELGFKANISIEEGLKETINWYVKERKKC